MKPKKKRTKIYDVWVRCMSCGLEDYVHIPPKGKKFFPCPKCGKKERVRIAHFKTRLPNSVPKL